jgi:hypothetical protein
VATIERELYAGYEWELDFSCCRCGSTHNLIFDKENEKMYCGSCWLWMHRLQETPAYPAEGVEEEDLVFQ